MTGLPALCRWQMVSTSAPRPTAKWITARVLAMQSHFYLPDLSPEIEALAMADWIAVLGDVPQAAIEQAIGERLRSPERARPTPGEIRERALARVEMPAPEPKPVEEPRVVISLADRRRIAMELGLPDCTLKLKQMAKCEGDGC